jgi:hypothetical protein
MTVDVNDLTFGVEFEVTVPRGTCEVGGYHCGRQVPALPAGWNAQQDGSIRSGRGYMGAEIVSPILKGADGIRQMQTVCRWLASVRAKVNRSTGFHVHVGFDRSDAEGLRRLVSLIANFEKALYASTGSHERERGVFCRTVQNDQGHRQHFSVNTSAGHFCPGRYRLLNVTNLLEGRKPTVEFRVFSGTTNALKAIAYVRLCLGFVEKALSMKKLPKWIAKTPVETSPIHRKGEGQTAIARLFYGLGWTKGREDHMYGNVEGADLPRIQTSKNELVRLAKQYDTPRPTTVPPLPAEVRSELYIWNCRLQHGDRVECRYPSVRMYGTIIRCCPRTLIVRLDDTSERVVRIPRLGSRRFHENHGAFPLPQDAQA